MTQQEPGFPAPFAEVLEGRSHERGVIAVAAIPFDDAFERSCRVCVNYHTRWNCPPVLPSPGEQRNTIGVFGRALIFTTKHPIENSFDFDGMFKALGDHRLLTVELHERFGRSNPVFGAGGCHLCKQCAWPEPCRNPQKLVSSMEAAGIDVYKLSRIAGLAYNNGKNTVTFFGMILFNA
jgi:predicted metal-binding protein